MDKDAPVTQETPAVATPGAAEEAAPTVIGEAAAPQAAPAAQAESAPATGAQAATAVAEPPAGNAAPDVDVRPADFPRAQPNLTAAPGGQVDILLETMMPVAASLGQVKMPVRQLLQLGQGSVVRLDREVGAPIDLLLRGIKFATGHLVVVGEHLGVRINEILPVNATGEETLR
jgi:flagellar motor switch protein FliN